MEPYFDRDPSRRGKALIQKVEITGTRDEIIKAREEINRILRIKSNGVIRPKFELIN